MAEREPRRTAGGRPMGRREVLRITAVGGLALSVGGPMVRELLRQGHLTRVSETRALLGTLVSLTGIHPRPEEARALVAKGFATMEGLSAVLNRHDPDTAMARLNREGRLHPAPPELRAVLERAEHWHRVSGGAFDPTVAPLLALYERSAREGRGVPAAFEIDEARARTGFHRVRLGSGEGVTLAPGTSLTLDGIAKGYVVDRTVDAMVAEGAHRVLVDAGGDLGSGGDGSVRDPWAVGVQDPRRLGGSVGTVRLRGDAVATSGDYLRSFTEDRSHHHILDPRTGRSPEVVASATVQAATAMDADALSTALMVLGPGEGLALVAGSPGAEALVVDKDGRRHASPGWSDASAGTARAT